MNLPPNGREPMWENWGAVTKAGVDAKAKRIVLFDDLAGTGVVALLQFDA